MMEKGEREEALRLADQAGIGLRVRSEHELELIELIRLARAQQDAVIQSLKESVASKDLEIDRLLRLLSVAPSPQTSSKNAANICPDGTVAPSGPRET